MRWDSLSTAGAPPGLGDGGGAQTLPLAIPGAVARTFDTPEFRGITCYEVHARSILNRVPAASRMPFEWTINPYRGCTHACTYCFARGTHTYLDLDAGHDFDTKVIVKVNAVELLRRELAAPRWRGEHIAMGTNVDCYQRAEGRYRMMPGIIAALRERANPFSILTKGTLILRDLPLLRQAAAVTEVTVSLSIGFLNESLWRSVEPGTPSPRRRLDTVRQLADAGFAVGVLMAPILPGLTDTPESIEETVAAIAAAGAARVVPISLHLRPGARQWYLSWLTREHPELVDHYRARYGGRAYLSPAYQRDVAERVRRSAHLHGIRPQPAGGWRRSDGSRAGAPEGLPGGRAAKPPASGREPGGARQLTLL